MIIFRDTDYLELTNDTAVTVGKFDGIHKGHQTLLKALKETAGTGLKTMVICLRTGHSDRGLITTEEECADVMAGLGMDYLVDLKLDEDLMALSAEAFVRGVLIEKCRMKAFVCGTDFTFGRGRSGTAASMKAMGEALGFDVRVLEKEASQQQAVSSTRIRELIEDGRAEDVELLLGRPYSISGEVIHGRQLAASLGFPTANVLPDSRKILPPFGVYAVHAVIDGVSYPALSNIGVKPTITDEHTVLLEVSLIGVSMDLYGKQMKTEFLHFIRPERQFPSLEALKEQLNKDYEECCRYFGR